MSSECDKEHGHNLYRPLENPYSRDFLPSCGDLGIPLMGDCRIPDVTSCGDVSGANFPAYCGYSPLSSDVYCSDAPPGVGLQDVFRFGRLIHSPSLQLDGLK